MITKHTDTYFTNKYGNRFTSEELAEQDEKNRDHSPFKVKTILPNIYFENFHGEGIDAINDYGKPWTGQMNDKTKVYLFQNIVAELQKLMEKYGDNIGYTHQHFGMGNFMNAIVLLEKNNHEFPENAKVKLTHEN